MSWCCYRSHEDMIWKAVGTWRHDLILIMIWMKAGRMCSCYQQVGWFRSRFGEVWCVSAGEGGRRANGLMIWNAMSEVCYWYEMRWSLKRSSCWLGQQGEGCKSSGIFNTVVLKVLLWILVNVVGEMKLDEVCQQGLKKIIIYICR